MAKVTMEAEERVEKEEKNIDTSKKKKKKEETTGSKWTAVWLLVLTVFLSVLFYVWGRMPEFSVAGLVESVGSMGGGTTFVLE